MAACDSADVSGQCAGLVEASSRVAVSGVLWTVSLEKIDQSHDGSALTSKPLSNRSGTRAHLNDAFSMYMCRQTNATLAYRCVLHRAVEVELTLASRKTHFIQLCTIKSRWQHSHYVDYM